MNSRKLVLIRHGESIWNKMNLFTGWIDVELSDRGKDEARSAGDLLMSMNYSFDVAFTSVLKRAIHTLEIVLGRLNQGWIEVKKSWRLNERHYGALQGENKKDMIEKYGEKQVKEWRRSFHATPPKIDVEDWRFPGNDPRYSELGRHEIPLAESLSDVTKRLIPFWSEAIVPLLISNRRVLIVSHGNSIRAMIKHVGGVSEENFSELEISTGVPVVLEFGQNLEYVGSHHLVGRETVVSPCCAPRSAVR